MKNNKIKFTDFLENEVNNEDGLELPSLTESHSKCVTLLSIFFNDSEHIYKDTKSETLKLILQFMGQNLFEAISALSTKMVVNFEEIEEILRDGGFPDELTKEYFKWKYQEKMNEMETE